MSTNGKLTPKLRFPEFRKGPGWDTELMEQLYSFMRNNALSRDKLNYESGTVKNIHYGDIHTKFPTLFDITKELVPFINPTEPVPPLDSEDYCIVGDLIFADASEDTNDVGKSIEIVNLNGERLLSGQHTILARRNDERLIVGFGGYLFRSGSIRSQIQKESQGTKVYAISSTRMASVEIAFPGDKKEQQKIADCLSSLDDLIAAEGRKLKSLRAYKKGLIQQLFPRDGETTPRLRFPEFQGKGEWAIRKLSDFIVERNEVAGAGIPLFSLTIEKGVTAKTERYERSFLVNDEESAYKVVMPNDFAFNPMNLRFGAIARHAGEDVVALSKYYNIFYCDHTMDPRFCGFYFKTDDMVSLYDRIATGSLIEKRRVHFDRFLKLDLPFPALGEQQLIADCFFMLDERIDAQSAKLAALRAHKKGLMQQLFPSAEEAEA